LFLVQPQKSEDLRRKTQEGASTIFNSSKRLTPTLLEVTMSLIAINMKIGNLSFLKIIKQAN